MPEEQLYSKFANIQALEAEKQKVLDLFLQIKKGIVDLSAYGSKIDLAKTMSALSVIIPKVTAEQAKLLDSQNKLVESQLRQEGLMKQNALLDERLTQIKLKNAKAEQDAIEKVNQARSGSKTTAAATTGKLPEVREIVGSKIVDNGTLDRLNDLERKEIEIANAATAMGESHTVAAAKIKTVVKSFSELAGDVNTYTNSLKQNIAVQLDNVRSLDLNRANQKAIEQEIKRTGFATDEQKVKILALKEAEVILTEQNKALSATISLQAKEFALEVGSAEQLQVSLKLLNQQYNNLTKGEKSSTFGVALKAQITEMEQAGFKAKELTLEEAKLSEQNKVTAAAMRQQAREALGLNDAYRQLEIRFQLAAREAKNLAAQYGVNDKRAQDAAKSALNLNQRLKDIDASVGQHTREVGHYEKAWHGVKEKLKEVGTVLLGFIGIQAGIQFLHSSVDAFLELDKTLRQLEQTAKNTEVPGLFERLQEQTHGLMEEFKALSHEDLASSFSKLVVFGKLSEKQIKDLMPLIINYARGYGKTLPEATAIFLRALEGQARGFKELGLNVKDGHTAIERYGIIMDELKPKVEGVEAAFEQSAAGGIAKNKQSIKELKEEIGSGLAPVMAFLLNGINDSIKGWQKMGEMWGHVVTGGEQLIDFFTRLGGGVSLGAVSEAIREQREETELAQGAAKLLIKEWEDAAPVELAKHIGDVNTRLNNYQKLLDAAKGKTGQAFDPEDVKRYSQQLKIAQFELKGLLDLSLVDTNKPLSSKVEEDPEAKRKREEAEREAKQAAEEAARRAKDYAKKEREAKHEIGKLELQDQIDLQKAIANLEGPNAAVRITARANALDLEKKLVDYELKFRISAEGVSASQIELARKQHILKIHDLETQSSADIIKIKADEIKMIQEEGEKLISYTNDNNDKILKDQLDEAAKWADSLNNQEEVRYQAARQLAAENFISGKTTREEYNNEIEAAEAEHNRRLLKGLIEYYTHQRNLMKAAGEDVSKLDAALAEASAKLATMGTDKGKGADDLKYFEQVMEKKKELVKKLKESFKDLGATIADTFKDIVGGTFDAQKNAIQDQIDDVDRLKAVQIKRVTESVDAEETKAARIAIIEAKAQSNKEQLEKRQRQIDRNKAIFERAFKSFQIVTSGIETIAKIKLANAELTTFLLRAVASGNPFLVAAAGAAKAAAAAQIPIAIASTAAQLAALLGTPIPKYSIGKNKDKDNYQGPAIVGDGGKNEIIIRKSGKIEITPNTPTITWVGKKDIILPDADKAIAKRKKIEKLPVKAYAKNNEPLPRFYIGKNIDDINLPVRKEYKDVISKTNITEAKTTSEKENFEKNKKQIDNIEKTTNIKTLVDVTSGVVSSNVDKIIAKRVTIEKLPVKSYTKDNQPLPRFYVVPFTKQDVETKTDENITTNQHSLINKKINENLNEITEKRNEIIWSKPTLTSLIRDIKIYPSKVTEAIFKAVEHESKVIQMPVKPAKEYNDENVLKELKELNKKPTKVIIINNTPIETTAWYQDQFKR